MSSFFALPNENDFVEYLEETYGVTNARKAEMRKVEFGWILTNAGAEKSVGLQTGWFHAWGVHSYQPPLSNDVARWTVAIVEATDGQAHKVSPNRIKFIEG